MKKNALCSQYLTSLPTLLAFYLLAPCLATTPQTIPFPQARPFIKIETIDESISRMDKLIRHDPKDGLLYTNRAEYLNAAQRYNEALRDSDNAVRLLKQSGEAHKQRAWALSGLKRWSDALNEADQYVRLAPDSDLGVAYGMRGGLELRTEKYSQAIADFNSAIQINHEDARLFLYRAYAFCGFGVFERAAKDCTKCLELIKACPGEYELQCEVFALATRAMAYDKLGQHNLAQQDRQLETKLLEQHHK
jgi:tetratricopeptide (TPR) repeat protein